MKSNIDTFRTYIDCMLFLIQCIIISWYNNLEYMEPNWLPWQNSKNFAWRETWRSSSLNFQYFCFNVVIQWWN